MIDDNNDSMSMPRFNYCLVPGDDALMDKILKLKFRSESFLIFATVYMGKREEQEHLLGTHATTYSHTTTELTFSAGPSQKKMFKRLVYIFFLGKKNVKKLEPHPVPSSAFGML
jgi:hypothetical protein